MVENLWIIGNGFDKHFGLPTNYIEFFQYLIKKNEWEDINLKEYNYEVSEMTLFELYFLSRWKNNNKDIQWADIEHALRRFLLFFQYAEDDSEYFLYRSNKPDGYTELDFSDSPKINDFDDDFGFLKPEDFVLQMKRAKKEQGIGKWNWIYMELTKFEELFEQYLRSNDVNNPDKSIYDKDKKSPFTGKNNIETENFYNNFVQSVILSFNYTIYLNTLEPNIKLINIHGTSEPIFGIDSLDIKSHTPLYKFTKTFRIMTNNQSSSLTQNLPRKEVCNEINVFGHSLGNADYSYFQSIFDYYNIYDSAIVLNFYYDDFDGEGDAYHKNNMVLAASGVLRQYGVTMGNPNRENNLIHKLVLEQRLKVKQLPRLCKEMII